MRDIFDTAVAPLTATPDQAEPLLRDYLEHLLTALDLDRVRASGGRERALACFVGGAVAPLAEQFAPRFSHQDLCEIAFGELEDRLGWYDEDASVLGLYAGVAPATGGDARSARREGLLADPYGRYTAHWRRCAEVGRADFADWCERPDEHDFARAASLVDGAALAVGDEW